jgi:O-antigen/teichoic acid export membrane protein
MPTIADQNATAGVDFARPTADAPAMPGAPDPSLAGPRHRLSGVAADGWARVVGNPSAMIVATVAAHSGLRMLSNIVLARLLAPSVFALVSITTLVLVSIHMVSDVGIAITALREGDLSRDDENRLWTMQAIRGVGMALIVAAAAVPVGWLYGDLRLRDALLVLAVTPILDGIKSLYPILAMAHRRLLPTTAIELGGRVVSIFTSVGVALVSPTLWSLVIATLTSMVFSTGASYVAAGRLPRFRFDRAYVLHQWRFARWIQTSSTLTFAGSQLDKAMFPFLFGMSELGVYGIAATLASVPSQISQRWSGNVFYPLATQMLRDEAGARARLMAVRTTMLLYSLVGTLAIMAISFPFFLLLYPARYHDAAAISVVLGAGTFFEVSESSLRHFPLVEGTPHYEVWTVLVRLAAFLVGVGIVMLTGAGVPGYALSYVGGLAASHLFMLTVDVRRGYLRPGFDLLLIALLGVGGLALYLLPLTRTTTPGLLGEGVVIALAAGTAMLLLYRRRGLPSLPAEPAPPVVHAVAEDEFGHQIEDGLTYP